MVRPGALVALALAAALGSCLLPGAAAAEAAAEGEPPFPPVASEPSAAAHDAVRGRIAEVRARLEARIRDPGIAADLFELHDLGEPDGNLERLADAFVRVAWNPKAHQEARALAGWLLADVERRRGRLPRMQANLDALGIITDAALIGPFDNENKGGFDVVYGPERELDLGKPQDGLRGEVRWRTVNDLGATGPLWLYEAMRPARGVVVYALVILDAAADRPAVLQLGASGATKVWLNGKPVLLDPTYHPARFAQDAAPLSLRRGENTLLVKLATDEATLGLILRVVEPDGDLIRGLTTRAPKVGSWPAPAPFVLGRGPVAQHPLLPELRRAAEAPGATPRALQDYARFLGARRPFDDAEKLQVSWAAKAAAAAPGDVDAQLLAADAEVDDGNLRRGFLEAAVKAERPGEARAHDALARHFLERGQPWRARELLASRLDDARGDWLARLTQVRTLDALGLTGKAKAELVELARRNADQPAILKELASYHRRDDEGEAGLRALRVAAALSPADDEIGSALASLLTDRGAVDEALHVLAATNRFAPLDTHLLLRRADLLSANGRLDEALPLYERATAICPDEGDFHERLGKAALRAGNGAAALAAFERSLAVRPQDAGVRELLRSLKPGAASFARPYLHELRATAAAAEGRFAGEDAATLVELTALKILRSGQASRTVQVIRKVLTQRGVEDARFQVRYAPEREELKVERARVLKPDGSIVDSHGEDDESLHEPWAGLYYDARSRVLGFPGLAPGDVLELVYRIDDVARDNLLSDYFGDVSFVQDVIPKATFEYVIDMPPGRALYANEVPGAVRTQTPTPEGGVVHRWVAKDVAKVVPEPEMPGWSEVATYLHVSTYRDWESVARFWWGLVQDQVAPTPAVEKLAKEVVAGIPEADVAARVRAVYDFVVLKTRYVGLEFGIHSFKPYKVERILSRRFGDCKDKASLMQSLLRTLGIESRLTLLRMRDLGRVGGEPASLAIFNHAILYVPSLDLFLDGTAEWSGSGELPEVDHGAEALVVSPAGGSSFRVTPEARAERSVSASSYKLLLDAKGDAVLTGESNVKGLGAPGYRRAYASPNGRRASFEQAWARSFPGLTVRRLDVSDVTRIEEDVKLTYELLLPRYAEPTPGGGLSFTPFGSGASYVESYAALSTRRFDLVIAYPWTTTYRYEHTLPPGLGAAQLPAPVTETSPFGTMRLSWTQQGELLVAQGEISLTAPRVTPAEYPAFRAFLGRVDAAMARKVVLAPLATASAAR